ncbi:D-alanyl-D-alanine carboxypeptidase family protein [Ectobacillus sp. sgz5001026]|uniref:D-alanyl-D-alanine carboxypeptidase family protein n=1 Tax=Ectobacillus sp. sgz5001026 TaxID=3242473 RepID=UPI0036D30EB8
MALLLFGVSSVYAEEQPHVVGEFAVSMDAKSGDVLYDKQAHHRAYPASITKVLTAILMMEHMKPGERITFSQKALGQEKSNYQVDFHVGDSVDRDTALTIMMVLSANDMAYAIAEHISGSAEDFSSLMNEKANELGAKDSHFVTPNGLHDPNHYTSPYDMALIAREASKYPEIMKAMNTKRTTVTTSRQTISILNKAKYFDNPNVIAGKTGFTNEAHNTLVQINEKNGNRIINVVMSSRNPEVYEDAKAITNDVFPLFEKQHIVDKTQWSQKTDLLGQSIPLELERSSDLVLKKGEGKNVNAVFHPLQLDNDSLYEHGIVKGQMLGQVDLIKNGQVIDSIHVLSKESATFQKPPTQMMMQGVIPIGIGLLALVLIGSVGVRMRKRKQNISA